MAGLKIEGVEATPEGVRLHFKDAGEVTTCDLAAAEAGDLALTLLGALNRVVGGLRLPVGAEGLSIAVGMERPGHPQPVRLETQDGVFIFLDLSWSAARKLQDLTEGLMRASTERSDQPS